MKSKKISLTKAGVEKMSSKELGKILGGKVDPGDTTSVGTSNSTTTSLATETEQIAETEVDQIP